MRKKIITTTILSAFLCTFSHAPAALAADSVQVTLPSFTVTLNGQVIDNSYRQYPLLVYKDITYFPMTYYDCRFLGVETDWSRENGLRIAKTNLSGAYHQQNTVQKNSHTATARITSGKITVNNKNINNSKEQYPLLSYRDVTYFPLTWRFAVNEFGWKYSFDSKNGLNISASNPKTTRVTLTDTLNQYYSNFILDANYFYYQGENGAIYRRPLSALQDDTQRQTVMTLPAVTSSYSNYPNASFYKQGGNLYMRYPTADWQKSCHFQINKTPIPERILDGNEFFVDYGEFQIYMPASSNWTANEITIITPQGQKTVREKNMMFQIQNLYGTAYDSKQKLLYLTANDTSQNTYSNDIYTLNPFSGEIKKITSEKAFSCTYCADTLYLWENEIDLSALDLSTGKKQSVATITTMDRHMLPTEHGVFYKPDRRQGLYFWNKHTGKTELLNNGAEVYILEEQHGYITATFEPSAENPYRLMVFVASNQGYKQVFASADVVHNFYVNANGVMVYQLSEDDKQFVTVQLPKIQS